LAFDFNTNRMFFRFRLFIERLRFVSLSIICGTNPSIVWNNADVHVYEHENKH
jgi:hypothetical protein